MPDWHIDYFELKLLKKQTVQETHSYLLIFLWMQELSFLYERYPINQEMETSLQSEIENLGQRRPYKQILLLLH